MANGGGLIHEGLWRKDKDFQKLPRLAQCTYVQVLSQKDLDTAGGLTLHLELMAKACAELTVDQLKADFTVLEKHRFLFVDYDTDELLVRSYVRLVSGNSPKNNAWRSVPKNAKMIASEKLRRVLAAELRRLRWQDAVSLADEIDPNPSPSGPPSNPLGTRSEGTTPFEGASDPPRSVPVSVPVSPSVGGYVGERRPECSQHQENSDTNCRACMRRRQWDEQRDESQRDDELAQRRQLRDLADNCPTCKGTNWIPDTEPAVKCDHQAASNA